MNEIVYQDLGKAAYGPTVALQERLLAEVQAGGRPRLLLVEHCPPAVTLGRKPCDDQLLASPAQLKARGIELHRTRRGGGVTYHGPGQLVGYPIVPLANRSVREYVHCLEEAIIRTLGRVGVIARRKDGYTGVWASGHKVAAIGVAVSRWVAWHGFSINVSPDMSHFDFIVPCGLRGESLTSVSQLLHRFVSVDEIKPMAVECFCEVFGMNVVPAN